ncbi:Glucan endo-1,3-alpha-glucosidase agn1 [Leucoagaricus sp. SymC.cos]|nr:Glucan endo-1,3-alpha-glucosidase agn1 [Leucoagaricus sp. SymC.cos]
MFFILLFTCFLSSFLTVKAGRLPLRLRAQSSIADADQILEASKNATISLLNPPQDSQRYVFMHHLAERVFDLHSYDYTVDDWKGDLRQIGLGGVDAVALNFGSDSWQNDQLHNAYNAATSAGIQVFLSFDFSAFPCDVNSVVATANQFISHGSQFKVDGRPLISSYLGKCLGNQGWQEIKDKTNGYLMPFIAEIEGEFDEWKSLDSWFCWGCAWPQGDTDKTTADDQYYLKQLGTSTKYVTSVSPWMFTHYDYKNFYLRGDNWLISSRWEQLVEMRNDIPMVEMITWNDFGESDYYSSVKGLQPSGTTWANGYSHISFFELSQFYIMAYKTGKYPTILQDAIYFWARPHPARATAFADSLARPSGFDFAEDYLWALVFATRLGQVSLTCGNSTQKFTVDHGVNKLKLPLSPGKITVSMARNGSTLIEQSPSDFSYSSVPQLYNYNVYIGGARSSGSALTSAPLGNTPYPTSAAHSTTSATATTSPTLTPTEVDASWSYYGYVEEGTSGSRRALTGSSYSRQDMTPQLCQNLCSGYLFAGVEYGHELAIDMCATSDLALMLKQNWKSLGCYADSPSRLLKGPALSRSGMTTAMCTAHCSSLGFHFAATEYGVECYCGSSLEQTSDGAGVIVDQKECDVSCGGNSSEKCGGSWHASVYSYLGSGSSRSKRQHSVKKKRRIQSGTFH